MSEKSFVDLLNAYLAVESLLSSRYISAETREVAVTALGNLNRQFAQLVKEKQAAEVAGPPAAADTKSHAA